MHYDSMTLKELHSIANEENILNVFHKYATYINAKMVGDTKVYVKADCRYVGISDGKLIPQQRYAENSANIFCGYVEKERQVWVDELTKE